MTIVSISMAMIPNIMKIFPRGIPRISPETGRVFQDFLAVRDQRRHSELNAGRRFPESWGVLLKWLVAKLWETPKINHLDYKPTIWSTPMFGNLHICLVQMVGFLGGSKITWMIWGYHFRKLPDISTGIVPPGYGRWFRFTPWILVSSLDLP